MSDNSTLVFTLYHVFILGSWWFLIRLLYICNNLYFSFRVERIWIFPQRNYECSQSSRTPVLISPHFHWWCSAPFPIPVLVQGKGPRNAHSSQWQGWDCISFALGESFHTLRLFPIIPLSGQIPEILSWAQFCKKCDLLSLLPSVASESCITLGREAVRKSWSTRTYNRRWKTGLSLTFPPLPSLDAHLHRRAGLGDS